MLAQSSWEVPQTPEQKAEAAKKAEKEAKKAEKAAKKAEKEARKKAEAEAANRQRMKDAQTEIDRKNAPKTGLFDKKKSEQEIINEKIAANNGEKSTGNKGALKCDAKYLDGALSYNDKGRIEWTVDIDAKGKSASQIYDMAYSFLDRLTSGADQIKGSRIALVNKEEHKVIAAVKEWMVFKSSALSLDRTQINYAVIVECKDGKATFTLTNISYDYEQDRPTAISVAAEEWIDDKNGMNKKHTNVSRMSGKFRKGTIDRKDKLVRTLADMLKS